MQQGMAQSVVMLMYSTSLFSDELVQLELEGSPTQVVVQPPGVVVAVNSAGQSYHATTGIVYTSEFSDFYNDDPSYACGNPPFGVYH